MNLISASSDLKTSSAWYLSKRQLPPCTQGTLLNELRLFLPISKSYCPEKSRFPGPAVSSPEVFFFIVFRSNKCLTCTKQTLLGPFLTQAYKNCMCQLWSALWSVLWGDGCCFGCIKKNHVGRNSHSRFCCSKCQGRNHWGICDPSGTPASPADVEKHSHQSDKYTCWNTKRTKRTKPAGEQG